MLIVLVSKYVKLIRDYLHIFKLKNIKSRKTMMSQVLYLYFVKFYCIRIRIITCYKICVNSIQCVFGSDSEVRN